jgi:hypothetical protein
MMTPDEKRILEHADYQAFVIRDRVQTIKEITGGIKRLLVMNTLLLFVLSLSVTYLLMIGANS